MNKTHTTGIVVVLAAGLLLCQGCGASAKTPADLVKTMRGTGAENERRLAALHLYDTHLGEACWTADPDLSVVRDLAFAATSDPSPKVRAAALDSIRRTIGDIKLEARTALSPIAVASANAHREANRRQAADMLIDQFLTNGGVKVLEGYLSGNDTDNLVVEARHVLGSLLALDAHGKLALVIDEPVKNEIAAWAKATSAKAQ